MHSTQVIRSYATSSLSQSSVWPSGDRLHKETLSRIVLPECSFFTRCSRMKPVRISFEKDVQRALRINYIGFYIPTVSGEVAVLYWGEKKKKKSVLDTVGGFIEALYCWTFSFSHASVSQTNLSNFSDLFSLFNPPFRDPLSKLRDPNILCTSCGLLRVKGLL